MQPIRWQRGGPRRLQMASLPPRDVSLFGLLAPVICAPNVYILDVELFKPEAEAMSSHCEVFGAVSRSLEQPDVCLFCGCNNSFFGTPVLFQVALEGLAL